MDRFVVFLQCSLQALCVQWANRNVGYDECRIAGGQSSESAGVVQQCGRNQYGVAAIAQVNVDVLCWELCLHSALV